ncbi:MMPL family transporter [Nocardia sp. AG03]|uniref:MMPL family transporter n=1 Tax=Nocardia sp. AG03 TaxID=3025312 RepID=UPI002418A9C9|nr:MMPL family transporter [Nocardia sp. AG03]
MFTRWGDLVYRFRFAVIGVVGAALLALGAYGTGLGDRLTQSGWFDPGSESVQGAELADIAFGRDHMADVIVMYNAPEGTTIDDPAFSGKIIDNLNAAVTEHPDRISKINGTYWQVGNAPSVPSTFGSKDKKHAFASIAIVGDNDTTIMANYRAVADVFYIPGVDVEVSGLQPLGVTLNDTIAHDTKRMEVLALPAVAVLLFFIFGGIVAAALPLIIGGLTIIGATGLVMILTNFTDVNSFVTGVVSMIGLGLAIDYGLFIVSRFREELAEGYDTRAAVRRSVVTAGRTVVFSATMIIASLGGVLLFPQGFLRSVAYGTIATVSLAALTAVTILPAMLAVLGPRVDMLGLKRFRKTQTAEQIENGFWGRLTRWVMKHPLKIAIPVTVGLLLLIIPVKNLAFGGINEKYLPPDNSTRLALEHFYEVFPQKKTDPIQLVFVVDNGDKADTDAIGQVWKQANLAPGLVEPFAVPSNPPNDRTIYRTSATLVDPTGNAEPTIDYLRSIEIPDNVTMYVTGQPTLMADSIDTLLELMPWMILIVLLSTFILMFLTFGSLVLPIKAALMSALGLGSTLGILTWIFIDGNGAGILNFTPQPISAPVLMLIIAIIYGLSTDYEVFLLSRMVEARAQGASTTEAVRIGTAQTGRIITAAALILLVVTGAFAFSDMVMMQYIAYGMIAALLIDATVLRMLLVPAIMKLLGDDCWWAPKWMKRIQEKIGMGEPILDDERPQKGAVVDLVKTTPITDPPTMQMTAVPDSKLAKTPRRPRTVAEIEAEAPTQHLDKVTDGDSARPRMAKSPDPTRPRASMLADEPTRTLPVVKPGTETPDSGEPTQILPVVKPDAPESSRGQNDSPSTGSPDTGLDLPGSGGSASTESGSVGAQRNTSGDTGFDLPGDTAHPGSSPDSRISLPGQPVPRSGGNPSGGAPGDFGDARPNGTDSSHRHSGVNGFGDITRGGPNGAADGFGANALGGTTPGAPNADPASFPNGTSRGPAGFGGLSNGEADSLGSSRDGGAVNFGGPAPSGSTRGPASFGDSPNGGTNFDDADDLGGASPGAPTGGPTSFDRPNHGGDSISDRAPTGPSHGPAGLSGNTNGGTSFGEADGFGDHASGGANRGPAGFGNANGGPGSGETDGFGGASAIGSGMGAPLTDGVIGAGHGADEVPGVIGSSQDPSAGADESGWGGASPRTPGAGLPGAVRGAEAGADESSRAGASPRTPGPPRGSERVQPPSGYVPPRGGENPAVPQVSTPGTAGFDDEPTPRPSIVTPTRPSTSSAPPPGIVTPPGIVNPSRPSMITPQPRPTEPPAGGTFSGFTPLPTPEPEPRTADDDESTEDAGFVPPATDFSVTPGAHRAEAPTDPETPVRPLIPRPLGGQETPSARDVFGTPVPVEPQEPSTPWNSDPETPAGDRGPVFSPVTQEEPTDPPATPDRFRTFPSDPSAESSTPTGSGNPTPFSDNTFAADPMFSPVNPADNEPYPSSFGDSNDTEGPATPPTEAPSDDIASTPPVPQPDDNHATTWHGAADPTPARRDDTPPQGPVGWAPPREPASTSVDQPGHWQAPDGFTPVPAEAPAANGTTESDSPTPESEEGNADNRNEIENWMAQLRSSRRGTPADDEGRHTGNEGRTVSVNELLRRREDDTE